MQLFLSVLLIIYLRIKYDLKQRPVFWLSLFFYIKLGTDLYGILNYTSWIAQLLTRPVLGVYRAAMGALELGMIASFILFIRSVNGKSLSRSNQLLLFAPAVLLFPVNVLLSFYFHSDLLIVFDLVKATWIGSMIFSFSIASSKSLKTFIVSMLIWSGL